MSPDEIQGATGARWRRLPLLTWGVVAVLLVGAAAVLAGTIAGLLKGQDVGYPDSSTLIRVGELVHDGHVYPDPARPPYLVSLYGPLTYVTFAVAHVAGDLVAGDSRLGIRLAIFCAFAACAAVACWMSRRLHGSARAAALTLLFAVSPLSLAMWTTQVRGDFLGLAFSLLAVHLFLVARHWRLELAAVACAGLALLFKQTFVAAPAAVILWHLYRRQWRKAALWAVGVTLIVAGGYGAMLWREPLMASHVRALSEPLFELKVGLSILLDALSQPVVPFAVVGGVLALRSRDVDGMLVLAYCVIAWLVAALTIGQVGANINYFWEPLMISAVLAGSGLLQAERLLRRAPILVTAALLLVLLGAGARQLRVNVADLRQHVRAIGGHHKRQARWDRFEAIVSGRRLLSTVPYITSLSSSPEIPDPYLNAQLELRGKWSSAPVVAAIEEGAYEVIIVRVGQADGLAAYRGLSYWNDRMWTALKARYEIACTFEDKEIWLPRGGSGIQLEDLAAAECIPVGATASLTPL